MDGQEKKEREFEIGKDESWFASIKLMFDTWLANIKRTYDEYQQVSLKQVSDAQTHFNKVVSDAQQHDNNRQVIAEQALQNAVETANMVSKQAVRHGDIAIDRQWNVDEVSALTAKSGVEADAMIVALAKAVAEILAAERKATA